MILVGSSSVGGPVGPQPPPPPVGPVVAMPAGMAVTAVAALGVAANEVVQVNDLDIVTPGRPFREAAAILANGVIAHAPAAIRFLVSCARNRTMGAKYFRTVAV